MKASKNQLGELKTLMEENCALKSDVHKRDKVRKGDIDILKRAQEELKELVNFQYTELQKEMWNAVTRTINKNKSEDTR